MLSLILTVVTVLIIGLLGLFSFYANPNRKANFYFAAFTGFLALWVIANFLENEPGIIEQDNVAVFLKLDFAIAVFAFFWFGFCENFAGNPVRLFHGTRFFVTLAGIGIALALMAMFTDLIITQVAYVDGIVTFSGGILLPLYILYLFFTCIGGLALLFMGRRRAIAIGSHAIQQQIDLIFLGFLLALGNALFINLVLQPFVNISLDVSRLGIYGLVIFVAMAAYAMVRHHLFDVKLAIIRTLTFTAVSLGLLLLYAYLIYLGTTRLFVDLQSIGYVIVTVLFTSTITLSFHPIHRKLAKFTQRLFYKSYYNSEKLLAELTHVMASNIDVDVMTQSLLHTLTSTLHAQQAAFLIYQNDGSFEIKTGAIDGSDFSLQTKGGERLVQLCHAHRKTAHTKNKCLFRELPEGTEKEVFRDLQISIIIPIRVSGNVIALLVLGNKKSGEVYSRQDVEFLEIFADEVGIALQNAQSYRTIQQFSKELENRVKERTKQLEESQKRELEKAMDVAKLKDEFVFIATHELRAPVTAIKIFLELTEAQIKHVPEALRAHITSIGQASAHLNQLIDDLLEIARSDSGTMKLTVQPVDIVQVIQSVCEELGALATERNITVSFTNIDKHPYVQADKAKLKEVVTNLLSNAIKYNKENGAIQVTVAENDQTVMTEIHDQGYGIPKDKQDKIFDKFYRATTKEMESIVGTGLGLFITRMLVEKMGGNIGFSAVENVGTTFAFSLVKSDNEPSE